MAVGVLDQHGKVDIRHLTSSLVGELRCKKHPRMRGLRRPRNRCERCLAIYEFAQRTGVREKRRPRKVVVETVTQ
jgi:hypothetical protein